MTSFNPPFEWENIQPNISSLDENDFMMLLQKQFPIMGSTNGAPTEVPSGKPDAAAIKSQTPSKFQASSTSPLSTDSSPSPPSARDDAGSVHSTDGNSNTNRNEEERHKRKASGADFDDDIGEVRYAKSQHTDPSDKSKRSQARRKSGGGEKTQDESRLMKRKEQNRAAQRAFRERKEKHVKDLEDKVAQLEAKTESQAAENENLRDMLSRLQSENTVLKQATFTFSVPSGSSTSSHASTSQSPATSTLSSPMNLFHGGSAEAGPSRLPSSSVGSPSNHDSPASMFDRFDNFSSLNNVGSPSGPSTSSPNNTAPVSTPDMDTLAVFGSTGPFTTISSNPMYMSYYDPIQSMNAFASFGGWDNDTTMANTATSSQTNDNQGLDGLFGDQLSGLIPLNSDFLSDGRSPSGSNGGASPVAHHNVTTNTHQKSDCPKTKEDVERFIATGPKGTFGSPVSLGSNKDPNAMILEAPVNEYDVAFQEALGKAKPPASVDSYNIDELCLEMQRKAKCSMGPC